MPSQSTKERKTKAILTNLFQAMDILSDALVYQQTDQQKVKGVQQLKNLMMSYQLSKDTI